MKKQPNQTIEETRDKVISKQSSDRPKYSVFTYIAILVIVVLLVIVLSYFIELRNHSETINSLNQQNTSALQKIEDLQKDNVNLQNQNETDKASISDLKSQITNLQNKISEMSAEQKASDANYHQLLQKYQELLAKTGTQENAQ